MLTEIVPIVGTVMTEKKFGLIAQHVCGVCVYWSISISGSVGVWSVCDVCAPACTCACMWACVHVFVKQVCVSEVMS